MENKTITIHLEDVTPFLDSEEAQRLVLRYLHDRGVEGGIGEDDIGPFIRYHAPDNFEEFSMDLYHFITSYKKK